MRQTPKPEADPVAEIIPIRSDDDEITAAFEMRKLFGHTGHTGALTLGQRDEYRAPEDEPL